MHVLLQLIAYALTISVIHNNTCIKAQSKASFLCRHIKGLEYNLHSCILPLDKSTDGSYTQTQCRELQITKIPFPPDLFALPPIHYRPWSPKGLFTRCILNTYTLAETNLALNPVPCFCQLQFAFPLSLSVFCINLSRNPHLSRNWAIVIYTIVLLNVYFGLPHFKYGFNDHSDFTQKGGVRTFGHYGRGLNYARLWLFLLQMPTCIFCRWLFLSRGVLCLSRSNT